MQKRPPAPPRNTTSRCVAEKLRSKKGSATLLMGIFGTVFIVGFIVTLFQRQELHIRSNDVSECITTVLTSTASSHLYNSYAAMRDGTSGAASFDGSRYREIKDTNKFRSMFASMYSDIELRGNDIVMLRDGRMVFTVSNLRLYVTNASGTERKSFYRAEYDLVIANGFLWSGSNTTLRNQVQTVEYMNRF